jgi:hypothetical protein
MKSYLEDNGFYKYELEKGYSLIRIDGKVASLYELHQLKSFILSQFTNTIKQNILIEKTNAIFDKNKLDFLTKYEGQFKNDTFDSCFIPFQNIVVKIKHNVELELITTDDLVNPIWESQIIKRDFRKLSFDEIKKRGVL